MRRRAIAIVGGRPGNSGPAALLLAESVGIELGRRGYGVVTGGDGGVAEAASRGCTSVGGDTLVLLKWNRLDDCGPETTWSLPTSMDLARSNILNWAGDGIVAFEGRYGTLAEIALALDTGRPLIVLGDQPLINTAALDIPSCRVIADPAPEDAPKIVDALEALIEQGSAPPVRPAAALIRGAGPTASGIGLRRSVSGDLPMFRRAFTDAAVLAWWDLPPRDEALAGFVHDRCLAITEHGRAVGFIEYHAEPDPDFDHIGLDMVIAHASDRGRGVGGAALALFAHTVFDAGHHRITMVPSPQNAPAVRCAEKAGFQRVGVMRAYERYRGRWRDALLLDLLPGDLRGRGAAP